MRASREVEEEQKQEYKSKNGTQNGCERAEGARGFLFCFACFFAMTRRNRRVEGSGSGCADPRNSASEGANPRVLGRRGFFRSFLRPLRFRTNAGAARPSCQNAPCYCSRGHVETAFCRGAVTSQLCYYLNVCFARGFARNVAAPPGSSSKKGRRCQTFR